MENEISKIIGACFIADELEGFAGGNGANVIDGLYKIALALENVARAVQNLADKEI